MKKIILLAALSSLSLFASNTFNDNYIEIGKGNVSNNKFVDNEKSLTVSKELNDDISVYFQYIEYKGSWNDPGEHENMKNKTKALGLKLSKAIKSQTDFTSSLEHVDFESKTTGYYTASGNPTTYINDGVQEDQYLVGKIGLRHLYLPMNMEVEINYALLRGSESWDGEFVELELVKKISNDISIGLEYVDNTEPTNLKYTSLKLKYNF